MRTFKVSTTFPERLQVSKHDSVSDAMLEFVQAQRITSGATSAVVETVYEDGSKTRVVHWER